MCVASGNAPEDRERGKLARAVSSMPADNSNKRFTLCYIRECGYNAKNSLTRSRHGGESAARCVMLCSVAHRW